MMQKYKFHRTRLDGRKESLWIEATDQKKAQRLAITGGGVITNLRPACRYFKFSYSGLLARERLLFIRQLALLITSSMTLSDSLIYLARQQKKPRIAALYSDLHKRLSEGSSFSEALRSHKKIFSPAICAVVYAGEKTGHLDEALESLSQYIEHQYRMKSALVQAILYPCLLIVVSLFVILALMTLAVPQIAGQLSLSGLPLPVSTRFLISISTFLQYYWMHLLGASCILLFVVFYALHHRRLRYLFDCGLLYIPLLGKVIRGTQNSLLLMTLDILIRFSVPALDAFIIIRAVTGNFWIKQKLEQACNNINKGASIGQALMSINLLDDTTLGMLSAGEKSGEFHQMVTYATNYLRKDMHNHIEILLKLLEPMLIFITGFIVLFIFMAIMQPMLNLNNIAI